jgi:hypothetical protein
VQQNRHTSSLSDAVLDSSSPARVRRHPLEFGKRNLGVGVADTISKLDVLRDFNFFNLQATMFLLYANKLKVAIFKHKIRSKVYLLLLGLTTFA